jgi:aspergillopepsin I
VTPHVLALQASNLRYPFESSSDYLHKRFNIRPEVNLFARQDEVGLSTADIQHDLETLGGRVYMTNVNLSFQPYTLVIDTGSSDTWVAASTFQCVSRFSETQLDQSACGFGKLYDAKSSDTRGNIEGYDFEVRYTD